MKKLEKIAIIGPVYPYNSGISHYTSMLCRNLREKYDVTMISFSLQYPKILFLLRISFDFELFLPKPLQKYTK